MFGSCSGLYELEYPTNFYLEHVFNAHTLFCKNAIESRSATQTSLLRINLEKRMYENVLMIAMPIQWTEVKRGNAFLKSCV